MNEEMYKIRRYYRDSDELNGELVIEGLNLSEAHAWVDNPETSSKTATGYIENKRTEEHGPWFEGFVRE